MTKEEFRKKLKSRLLLMRIYFLSYFLINLVVRLYDHFVGINLSNENLDFITGAVVGLSVVLLVAIAFLHLKYAKALNDDATFSEMYIEEIDERKIFIRQKSGADVLIPLSFVWIGVALIAGYFSLTVCITLFSVEFVQMIVCACLKIYYSKKY